MNNEQRAIIDCIDAFVDKMVRVVDQTVRLTVAAELDRIRANPVELWKKPVSRRGRKKPIEAKAPAPARKKRGAVKKEAPAEAKASPQKAEAPAEEAPPPAPLFVYKRAKDGRIERLNRKDEPEVNAGEEVS